MSTPLTLLDSALLDALPAAVLLVDSRGTIVGANQQCTSLVGYAIDELRGMSIERLVPTHAAWRHTAHRQAFHAKPALRGMNGGRDLAVCHRSGAEVPVEIALSPIELAGATHVLVTLHDMRGHHDLMQTLRLQSVALSAAASGVVITDRSGVITWVNAAAARITGYETAELLGQRPSLLKSGHHDAAFYVALWATVTAGHTWRGAIVNRRKDGTLYNEEQTIAPVADRSGVITHFIAIKNDVTARVRAEEALRETTDELARRLAEIEALHAAMREQAMHDPLTGLHNRRYLDETLPRELANAARDGTAITLAIIDVDNFKRVNDDHGHDAGDAVLRQLGGLLRAASRSGDLVCRFGGDEVVAVLIGSGLPDGERLANAWCDGFRSLAAVTAAPVTLSIGLAEWRRGEGVAALFARADRALYAAKAGGRARVVAAETG